MASLQLQNRLSMPTYMSSELQEVGCNCLGEGWLFIAEGAPLDLFAVPQTSQGDFLLMYKMKRAVF